MKSRSFATVILFSAVMWVSSALRDSAQDTPLPPAGESMDSVSSVSCDPADSLLVTITGRVHVARDDVTYRVMEVDLISGDGQVFEVLQEGKGKELVKVLKSRIVRVEGECRRGKGKPLIVVQEIAVIGSVKKAAFGKQNANKIPEEKNAVVSGNVLSAGGVGSCTGSLAAASATNGMTSLASGGGGTNPVPAAICPTNSVF